MAESTKKLWKDWKGEPISYFKMGDLLPFGREQYFVIFSKYLKEDLSKEEFCQRYQIGSKTGFDKMLKAFAQESQTYANQIKEKEEKENIIDERNLLLSGLVSLGKLPVEELIKKSKDISFEDAKNLVNKKWGKKAQDSLVYRVVNYFYSRVNAYSWDETNPENIKNMLSNDEVRFVTGNANYELLKLGKNSIVAPFLRTTAYLNGEKHDIYVKKVQGNPDKDIYSALLKHEKNFIKDDYFVNQTFLQTKKGTVEITPEIVDQAYNFVLENNIYPSKKVIQLAIKSVAGGEIEYSEISPERQQYIDRNVAHISKIKDMSEFMDCIDDFVLE